MMVVLVDKLVKTQIVECSAVANWIFSSELGSELTNFYVWEILSSTIEKMNRQVEKYDNELAELRRQLNVSAATSSLSTTSVDLSRPADAPIEDNPTEESKMDDGEAADVAEDKPTGNNLKRRRESDDDDEDEGEDKAEQESVDKVQSMQISQPPVDEATAKLHEKYDIVDERLTNAREQQK